MPSPRLLPRLALAAAALTLALALPELALRLVYDDLPSLAALSVTTSLPAGAEVPSLGEQPPDCRLPEDEPILHGNWELMLPSPTGEGEPLSLWTAGDSITLGAGVAPDQTFSAALARRLALSSGRPVALRDLGIQGAAYCDSIKDLHLWLDRDRPDAVVLQLFADDLEKRALYAVQGQVIAFPWRERDPLLRALASRSYLGNLAWSTVRARQGEGPTRGIGVEDQVAFRRAVSLLVARLRTLGIPHVLTLVAPTGLPRCADPTFAARVADCAWLTHDMDLLAVMLVQEGLPFVDLRAAWEDRPDATLAEERQELERRGRLPIHPDAAGHAALAEALWPALEAAMQAPPTAGR